MKYILEELICSECKDAFQSASSLLKHFALHANETSTSRDICNIVNNCDTKFCNKKMIPDLHPIVKNIHKESQNETVNPLIFCEATLNEDVNCKNNKVFNKNNFCSDKVKKYKCTYCQKHFGWSTDLKRHILTHTGERPFKCALCSLSFTRNFLLQKHISKNHKFKKSKIPDLKPIYLVVNGKMKKQSQSKTNKKFEAADRFLNTNFFEIIGNHICT